MTLDRGAGDRIFSTEAHVAGILRFEAALARAGQAVGILTEEDADAIAQACRVDGLDVDDMRADASRAGTIVVPILDRLRARLPEPARAQLHVGATSQDAIDTALVLQMREGLGALIGDLHATAAAAAALADGHRRSIMPGRTLLQHAVPITFGLKAARWLGALTRQISTLRALGDDALVLQFGGAAGTLAALGDRGLDVANRLAADLGLRVPDTPWHAERDRPASVVAALGVTAGVLAKIGGDIVLLSQTEIAEVSERLATGKGVSSAMPQKHNPVDATNAIAAARLAIGSVPVVLSAMAQEHERGAGGWQAEWVAIPDAFRHTLHAAASLRASITGLEVHTDRMSANLDEGAGTLMAESLATALAASVSRSEASAVVRQIVARCIRDVSSFADAARTDALVTQALAPDELDRALDPAAYLGSTDAFIDRAIRSWRELSAAGSS